MAREKKTVKKTARITREKKPTVKASKETSKASVKKQSKNLVKKSDKTQSIPESSPTTPILREPIEKHIQYSFKMPSLTSSFKKTSKKSSFNIDSFKDDVKMLEKLVVLQEQQYYKGLDCPKFMGETKYEILRLPSDLSIFKNIITQSTEIINKVDENNNPQNKRNEFLKQKYKDKPTLNVKEMDEITLIDIANLHGIDVSDMNSSIVGNNNNSDKVNIRSISKTLDKSLLKLRDVRYPWPSRSKKKKQGEVTDRHKILAPKNDEKTFNAVPWLS
ncbi:hypothetical protein TPHA_0L01630 [Tetrapisispora phaffii CBS 4417]|uniref:Uncharacterized protein n=1 Tax=Tetrapisispora phaffii (strain ATCC 24235 / CBS 4417 / NBRC 1672 / NRRL Y-8282 / UCD 70-5) TaxID=1071381 RepID=G8C038_TETPH|nr:hypothetical protein TPHA_0L01630 [Tetrapisispora phaffii CBS 4417]CCE65516.1 hypothetical protein TPHA_0L01630 [Tetrapisispora phaffii CBS 4417]